VAAASDIGIVDFCYFGSYISYNGSHEKDVKSLYQESNSSIWKMKNIMEEQVY